jgi:hypothetical protein
MIVRLVGPGYGLYSKQTLTTNRQSTINTKQHNCNSSGYGTACNNTLYTSPPESFCG